MSYDEDDYEPNFQARLEERLKFLFQKIKSFFNRPVVEPINLKYCAETANGIEKYGHFGYYWKLAFDSNNMLLKNNIRNNAIITGIQVPDKRD